jgi:hypothetical protein
MLRPSLANSSPGRGGSGRSCSQLIPFVSMDLLSGEQSSELPLC